MKNFMVVLCVSLCLFAEKSLAYTPQEGNVTAILGPYLSKTHFSSDSAAPKSYLGGLGLIANGDMNDTGALEIGIFQFRKAFYREYGANAVLEETQLLHITMGYRFWMSSKFSTSLAFYSSYSMGEPQIVYDNFAPGTTIDTSARDTTEYGLDWALQAELWQSGRYALILDGRYSLSFTNKRQEQSNHYGVLFGIRYFIQEQQIRKKTKTDL